jgi:prepilin-type N-terminal cleavage/methylation domain-containing protein
MRSPLPAPERTRRGPARSSRGFTLIEVMVAGAMSLLVVAGAFIALNRSHQSSIGNERTIELASQARQVLELIGRDIRTAGDSVQFLPAHCLQGTQAANAPFGCPAIMEAHPWRLTMSRYMWGAGADGIDFTTDDQLGVQTFSANPQNVVSYQFVPTRTWSSGGNSGFIGRLERIVNPYGFPPGAPQDPQRTVLLENVLLDNRLSVSPDGTQADPRRANSMFMYRILSTSSGEYQGHAAFTQRNTAQGSFILPPVRFYQFPQLASAETWAGNQFGLAPPYLPTYTQEIVGLQPNVNTVNALLSTSGGFANDLRYVLDYNRIRAVHVSFKVVEPREDPDYHTGIELNPATPGTARVLHMESTFELKVFSGYLR